ncbi:MAG: 2-hydroxyacyl-CoA dehydratase family protein [Planctomycetota bacterium]
MTNYQDPKPQKISLSEWDKLYDKIPQGVLSKYKYIQEIPKVSKSYVIKMSEYFRTGDKRLVSLKYDNSLAALRLWNFLLTEEERLADWRSAGKKLFGVMKDLGTIPVMVYSSDRCVAFYPDGAWWTPCFKELEDELFQIADREGVGEDACPVRATLGAFINQKHFPIPDLCIAGVGSCCNDFSAIMQRIAGLGHKFLWWELPYRKDLKSWYRHGDFIKLPNSELCPSSLVSFMVQQLTRIESGIEEETGEQVTDEMLSKGIKKANRLRKIVHRLRSLAYGTVPVPAAALELLICEMIVIHFCSDSEEAIRVLEHFLETVEKRVKNKQGILSGNPFRVTWVNPVADLRMMNLLEELGGCVAGTEYLFSHALDFIPEDILPMEALAYMVLSDPMIGSAEYRTRRIIAEAREYKAEGVIISRIPGASHCASESYIIRDIIKKELDIPVLDISVPSLIDSTMTSLITRIQAFFEILDSKRSISHKSRGESYDRMRY